MIKKIRDFFRDRYSYVNIQELSDSQLLTFIEQSYVKDLPFERQMDLMYDWILSQDLAEVTP
jgi:hypothetical protein